MQLGLEGIILNIYITPPDKHFDKGLGISAANFRDAANLLLDSQESKNLFSPVSYLQRHAIELYLKSLIYILHKKYNILFGESYSLDNPAILVNDKWKPLSNTHNLSDLYGYFKKIFSQCFELLPKTTDWNISEKLGDNISLVSGYDPKSTYFRYPESGNQNQDRRKSNVQPMDFKDILKKNSSSKLTSPIKCSIIFDSNDNVVGSYSLFSKPLENLKKALLEILDYIHNLHCAFLGELTKWS